jgi:hypothetical protein
MLFLVSLELTKSWNYQEFELPVNYYSVGGDQGAYPLVNYHQHIVKKLWNDTTMNYVRVLVVWIIIIAIE